MKSALDAFLAHVQSTGVMPQTIQGYRSQLVPLIAFLTRRGCRRIADVARDDLVAYIDAMVERELARSSRLDTLGLIRRWFAWMQASGRIVVNPAAGLPLPDDGEPPLLQPPLSEAEVAALIDGLPRANVFDLRGVCLMEVIYGCGLRLSEARRLDLADIDLGRRTVLVRKSKHGQSRLVPLPESARVALQTYLVLRRTLLRGPDSGALFLSERGGRISDSVVYALFDGLNAQAGPDGRHLHPHLLRHSIAVHLLRGGADIRYIQAFLGHANLNTTKIYLRLVPGHLAEDYEKAMPEIETGLGS